MDWLGSINPESHSHLPNKARPLSLEEHSKKQDQTQIMGICSHQGIGHSNPHVSHLSFFHASQLQLPLHLQLNPHHTSLPLSVPIHLSPSSSMQREREREIERERADLFIRFLVCCIASKITDYIVSRRRGGSWWGILSFLGPTHPLSFST